MSKVLNTTLTIVLTISAAGGAYADAGHHIGKGFSEGQTMPQGIGTMSGVSGPMGQAGMMGRASMMNGNHHEMMKMMMQMHGGMMGRMGQKGMMGGTGPTGMMDQDMMSLMRGPMMGRFDADANGDGILSGDEVHGQLQSMHAGADMNGDGALSLEEFDVLHGEIIRAMMVDRFQHLDTDGDGLVTADEMTAPADRMDMRPSAGRMMDDNMGPQDN